MSDAVGWMILAAWIVLIVVTIAIKWEELSG